MSYTKRVNQKPIFKPKSKEWLDADYALNHAVVRGDPASVLDPLRTKLRKIEQRETKRKEKK